MLKHALAGPEPWTGLRGFFARLTIYPCLIVCFLCLVTPATADDMATVDRIGKGRGLAYVVQDLNQVRFVSFVDYSDSLLAGSPGGLVGPASEVPINGSLARFRNPSDLVATSDGTLYVADRDNYLVRRIANDTNSTVSNLLIVDETGKEVILNRPSRLLLEADHYLYITDAQGRSVKKVRLEADHAVLELEIPLINPGTLPAVNRIGIPREHMEGGVGSQVILPVLADLEPTLQIRSLQYLAELSPITDSNGRRPPAIPVGTPNSPGFSAVSATTNGLIPLGISFSGQTFISRVIPTVSGDTNLLLVVYAGFLSNLDLRASNLVNFLAVDLPRTVLEGDRYRVSIKKVSGTLDAYQWSIPLTAMPDSIIEVRNHSYLVGDVSPSTSFNAEGISQGPGSLTGFGDGKLDNADANSVLLATFGIKSPPYLSDLFDAMDAFPSDGEVLGGDGQIRFLDWQVILLRSLGFDGALWSRIRTSNGFRTPFLTLGQQSTSKQRSLAAKAVADPKRIWDKDVMISSERVPVVDPSIPIEIPIYLDVRAGRTVHGLMFKAELVGLPAGVEPPIFLPRADLSAGRTVSVIDGLQSNQVAVAWSTLDGVTLPEGKQPLGKIVITPHLALIQFFYDREKIKVTFPVFEAVPDDQTQYEIERRSEYVAIHYLVLPKEVPFSDDWTTNFFAKTGIIPTANGDDDLDGVSNADEFAAGTNPVDFRLKVVRNWDSAVELTWLQVNRRGVVLESSPSISEGWLPVSAKYLIYPEDNRYPYQSAFIPNAEKAQFLRLRAP